MFLQESTIWMPYKEMFVIADWCKKFTSFNKKRKKKTKERKNFLFAKLYFIIRRSWDRVLCKPNKEIMQYFHIIYVVLFALCFKIYLSIVFKVLSSEHFLEIWEQRNCVQGQIRRIRWMQKQVEAQFFNFEISTSFKCSNNTIKW